MSIFSSMSPAVCSTTIVSPPPSSSMMALFPPPSAIGNVNNSSSSSSSHSDSSSYAGSSLSSAETSPSSTVGVSWGYVDPNSNNAANAFSQHFFFSGGSGAFSVDSSSNNSATLASLLQFPSAPSVGEGAVSAAGTILLRRTPDLRLEDTRTPTGSEGEDGGSQQSMSEDSTANGMTPTPGGKDSQFPISSFFKNSNNNSDSLSDLLDDLDACLPLGFDIEDLDAISDVAVAPGSNTNSAMSSFWPSPATPLPHAIVKKTATAASKHPTFKTPQEASTYIKIPRSDLDMEVQRCLRTYEKSESLGATVQKWQKESMLTEEQRLMSLKALVHEAGNRCLRSLKNRRFSPVPAPRRSPATPPPCCIDCDDPTEMIILPAEPVTVAHPSASSASSAPMETYIAAKARTYSAWKSMEENVASDHALYGFQTPQRHLSCMCIFNPTLIDTSTVTLKQSPAPLPCPYGENDDDRSQRSAQQAAMIRTIQMQQSVAVRASKTLAATKPKSKSLLECETHDEEEEKEVAAEAKVEEDKSYLFLSPENAALKSATGFLQPNGLPRLMTRPAVAAAAASPAPTPSWQSKPNHYCL